MGRLMSSSGDIIRCVVPSRQGVFSFSTTWPAALHAPVRWPAEGGGDVPHQAEVHRRGGVREALWPRRRSMLRLLSVSGRGEMPQLSAAISRKMRHRNADSFGGDALRIETLDQDEPILPLTQNQKFDA